MADTIFLEEYIWSSSRYVHVLNCSSSSQFIKSDIDCSGANRIQ